MGILDRIKGVISGGASRVTAMPALPALAPSNGVSNAQLDFTAGTNGREERLSWARYQTPLTSVHGRYGPAIGGYPARERNLAAVVSTDLSTSNPVIATIIENLTAANVGTGLTLSSKIDAVSLGISKEAALQLSSQIEKAWLAWALNPLECDLSGRHTFHDLASAGFKTWLRTGEIVATIDWQKCRGAQTRTKVSLLDPMQLDQTRTTTGPGVHRKTMQGVIFDQNGRVAGYYILPFKLGDMYQRPQPVIVRAYTSWGRQRVIHLFELLTAGQVRGLSPLTAALTPSHEKNSLQEFTLDAALLQTQYALTVESDMPAAQAFNGLATSNEFGPQGGSPLMEATELRAGWYEKSRIQAQPGVVNHLAPGDKLRINRAETPNSTYDDFDRSLTRSASKAAGGSYEDISGDYSDVNFSASRMASETPYRINMRRRASITERFYRAAFAAWLEEAISIGVIELPAGAPGFYDARGAYTASKWLGIGRVQPDPLKAAQATVMEIDHNLTTLADALAERGLDLETVLEERKAEKELMAEMGVEPDPSQDGQSAKPETPVKPVPKRKPQ
jgi:lambda family phage portal protein